MFKNVGSLLFSQIGIKLLAVGLGIYTSSWLNTNGSVEDIKDFNLIFAYLQVITALINFGIQFTIQKHFTNERNEKKLGAIWTTLFGIRIVTFFIGLLIILLTFPLSRTSNLVWILAMYIGQFSILADLDFRAVSDALGKTWQFSLSDLIGRIFFVTSLLTLSGLAFAQNDPVFFFIVFGSLSFIISISLDAFWFRKKTKFTVFDRNFLIQNSKPVVYLGISAAIAGLFLTTDRLFLEYFEASADQINGYSNGYKLFEISTIIPGLSIPMLSSIAKRKIELGQLIFTHKIKFLNKVSTFQKGFIEWFLIASGIGFLTTISVWIFAPVGSWLVDRGRFQATVPSIYILSLALLPLAPMTLISKLLIFFGSEKYELLSIVILLIFAISAYLLLIPNYGFIGAAIATVLINFLDLFLKLLFWWMHTKKLNALKPVSA